ncbi:Single-stranded DNA-binding protein [Leucobacter sp. BZR 635]
MSQQFSAVGQIATTPKLFTPAGGAEFCTFRLASAARRYDAAKQEWIDGDTNWFTVNTFRSLATHAKISLEKGDRIVVTGKLRVRQWTAEAKSGTSVEIDAEGIGHDLRFGSSRFAKMPGAMPRDAGAAEGEASPDVAPGAVVPGPATAADSPVPPEQLSADGFTPSLATT